MTTPTHAITRPALLIALGLFAANAAPMDHIVKSFPGLEGSTRSDVYSGFLICGEHFVHYMFAESEGAPAEDPLVLWMNGGPGSSSLIGFFQELGPLLIADNTTVIHNPYAWNTMANVLFLESPTGVGFSHCAQSRTGGDCTHDDSSTAQLNFDALTRFLELFPEYQGRNFMIWGESYAGVYIPTLSELIHTRNLNVNFLGFSVGNPCTSEHYQKVGDQVIFNLKFAADRGFISSNLYKFLEGNCVTDRHGPNKPDFTNPGCTTGWRLYYLATSDDDGLGPRTDLPHGGFVDPYTAYGPNEKDFDVMLREYMNWDAVKVALNVQDSPASPWGTPHLSYTKQYYACYYGISGDEPPPQYNSSMLPLYRRLAGKLQSITVYNGDTDPSIQFQGTEDAIRGLGLDVAKGGSWRPWFYMPKPAPVSLLVEKPPYWGGNLNHRALHSPQLAGYVTNYADNVTFATFHNSGHMVPMFRPQAALHFFERVMKGSALAPDLDMDMVERSSDDDFFGEGYMSRWVARAQSAEFTDSQSFHAAPGHRADGQRTARRADRLIDIV